MAGIIPLFVFILALIPCWQILLTEGRPIKSMNRQEVVRKQMINLGSSTTSSVNLHQSKVSLSGREQMQRSSEFVDFAAESKDDFRPTKPGFSPGVGHPKAVVTSSSTTVYPHYLTGAEDDKNNLHKSSHNVPVSVQQSMSGNEEITPPVSRNGNHGSAEEPESGKFRASAPGFRPGTGHHDAGIVTNSGTEHSLTGSIDDYRPTQPGHSPGVGHSYPNAKQNP